MEEGSNGANFDVLVGTQTPKGKVTAKEVGDRNLGGGALLGPL